MRAFFIQKFIQSKTLSREKLLNSLLRKKCRSKLLMKLTPAKVSSNNFTKISSAIVMTPPLTKCLHLAYKICVISSDRKAFFDVKNVSFYCSVIKNEKKTFHFIDSTYLHSHYYFYDVVITSIHQIIYP